MKIANAIPTRNISKNTKSKIVPYLYILPVYIFLITFLLMPLLTAFIKSFYRYDGLNLNEFIGLENYIRLFTKDSVFYKSLINLFVLFIGMNICFIFPIIAAKQLHCMQSAKLQYILRTVFILPIVVPSVVIMMLWKFIYYPQMGVIARLCSNFGISSPNLLGNPSTALVSVIIIGFPWITGLSFIIIYAALQGIDTSLIEAAKLDGASGIRIFCNVEIPIVMPQIKGLYILACIGQFQDYERFLILTQGGPKNATMVPGLHMYNIAFSVSGSSEYGYSCAIAVVLFIITVGLSKLLLNKGEDI